MSFSKWTSGLRAMPAPMRGVLIFCALLLLPLNAAAVEPLTAPAGPVILTVSGAIETTNSPEGAAFDRQMLVDLGVTEIRTSTPWTDGVQTFSGVLGRTVLERVGAAGTAVLASALNDYTVELPMSDFLDHDVLLALELNGEEMHISDKGPIWIVYPRDDVPALQDRKLHERWVWQLKALKIQ